MPLHSREDQRYDFLDKIRRVSRVLERPSKRVGELRFLIDVEAMLRALAACPLDNSRQLLKAFARVLLTLRAALDRQQLPDLAGDLVSEFLGRTSIEPTWQHCFPLHERRKDGARYCCDGRRHGGKFIGVGTG